jgi:TRAP-type transport system small permease protein
MALRMEKSMGDFEAEMLEGGGDERSLTNPFLRWADGIFAFAAGMILFLMMAMTTVDVIGRYLFLAPLGFAYEMTEIGMACLVFCALPSVTLRAQHVTVDLFDRHFHNRLKEIRDTLVSLLIIGSCLYLAWRMGLFAERLFDYGDRTSVVQFPTGIAASLGTVMFAITAIIACAPLLASLKALLKGSAQ